MHSGDIPSGGKHQRHIKVRGKMIAIGEQSNRLFRICHIVEAKTTARPLRHLQEAQKQGEAAKKEKQPCKNKPMAKIKLQHPKK